MELAAQLIHQLICVITSAPAWTNFIPLPLSFTNWKSYQISDFRWNSFWKFKAETPLHLEFQTCLTPHSEFQSNNPTPSSPSEFQDAICAMGWVFLESPNLAHNLCLSETILPVIPLNWLLSLSVFLKTMCTILCDFVHKYLKIFCFCCLIKWETIAFLFFSACPQEVLKHACQQSYWKKKGKCYL